jgi:hypothetical protein
MNEIFGMMMLTTMVIIPKGINSTLNGETT